MQEINAYFFGFENVPWSTQAEYIGYESRYFIENTGSLVYVYLLLMLVQLVFVFVIRAFASTTKVHKFAKSRQQSFFWSGKIGYFHEMYLNLSIGIGFNLGAMSMETAQLGFNTLFFVYIGVNAIVIPLLSSKFLYQ